MNTVDLLLKMDAGTLTKIPEGEMEIPRLSELAGEPFVIRYRALSGRRITELSDGILEDGGSVNVGRAYDTNLMLIGEALISPDLKNKELMKHYSAPSPKDLAEKLFLGGEVAKIADAVMKLSGYGKTTDADVKN